MPLETVFAWTYIPVRPQQVEAQAQGERAGVYWQDQCSKAHCSKFHVRLKRRMRSLGVTMSVSRMPNFSFTTTTSPCAIR